MAHTNSTTHYNLPQFVTTDKPAWLTDFNGAMSNIDTGIYNAQDKADDAAGDATQALSDAAAAQSTANTADGKGSGSVASIAPAFDNTATYSVGDLVMYNNLLYVCRVAITVPGAWTGSTNWTRTTAGDLNAAMDLRMDAVEVKTRNANPNITITKSSGAWNIQNIAQNKYGNVIALSITVIGSGIAVPAGTNGFVGTINVPPRVRATGVSFIGTGLLAAAINIDGSVTIRPLINNTNWNDQTGGVVSVIYECED